MDANVPPSEVDLLPEKIEDKKEEGRSFHCDLYDKEIVRKIAQEFFPGLATACVDNTVGDIFKTAGTVAVDIRTEMVHYLTQRSESFVAESVILQDPQTEVSDHPFDIISDFVDDFALSKRNWFSRVSGWLLSEKREDRIDDFLQEMEISGFWPVDRREAIAQTVLKNVDFKNTFHCNMKFNSAEELAEHVLHCGFKSMHCTNEGCNAIFSASQMEKHDSLCPFKIVPCEQKCSESLMRRLMDRHCITFCPMKLVNCSFYPVGCRSTVPQCMKQEHHQENLHFHLLYILQVIHKEISVDDLEKRAEQLKELFFDMLVEAADMRSLTFAVKDREAMLGPIEVSVTSKVSEEGKVNQEDEVNKVIYKEGVEGNEDGKISEEGKTNGEGKVNEGGRVDQEIEGRVNKEGKVNEQEKIIEDEVNEEGKISEGDKVNAEAKPNEGDKINEEAKANEDEELVNEKGKVKDEGNVSKSNKEGKANESDKVNEKGGVMAEENFKKESKANGEGKIKEEENINEESKTNEEAKENEGDKVNKKDEAEEEGNVNRESKANEGEKLKEEENGNKESKANGGPAYVGRKVNEGEVLEKGTETLNSETYSAEEAETRV